MDSYLSVNDFEPRSAEFSRAHGEHESIIG